MKTRSVKNKSFEGSIKTEENIISSVIEKDGSIGMVVICYDPFTDTSKKDLDNAFDMYSRNIKQGAPGAFRMRKRAAYSF